EEDDSDEEEEYSDEEDEEEEEYSDEEEREEEEEEEDDDDNDGEKECEDEEYEEAREEEEFDQRITFYEEKSYSSDCIRRISKNASIGYLTIVLTGSKKFHREIYNLIKEFDIGELNLGFESFRHQMLKEMMVDSFFLDLTKACKIIYLYDCEKITSEALYQVYQHMIDESTKLRRFSTIEICKEKVIAFLSLIEITYRDGRFFTNRDVQVYAYENVFGSVVEYSLFDEYLLITVNFGTGCFSLELHETRESLEKAKTGYGLLRIDINPE
ncbi:hypothetical protein PENTCL1PPCAC_12518, partial [Pristionchus entomophagus]